MTYEELKKANETIVTMTIEHRDNKTGKMVGKEYAEVNQRIKAFRMCYPEGFIHTELISNADGCCIFRAKVGYEDERGHHVLGTGTSWEKETSSFINKTSYIENSETSAVGRALGMAGFGIDLSVASAEEVQNAINNQEKGEKTESPKASQVQIDALRELLNESQLMRVLTYYKVERLEDLTAGIASRLIEKAREKANERET